MWLVVEHPTLSLLAGAAAVGMVAIGIGTAALLRRSVTTSVAQLPRDGRSLRRLIEQRYDAAARTSSLTPLTTSEIAIHRVGVIPFIVSTLCPMGMDQKPHGVDPSASSLPTPVDAFASIPPQLFVCRLSPTHDLILNRFPVIPRGHCVIVTSKFVSQDGLLDVSDVSALWHCVASVGGVGFFNSGAYSGASQPRRHVQFISSTALAAAWPADVARQLKLPPLPQQDDDGSSCFSSDSLSAPAEPLSFVVPLDAAIDAARDTAGWQCSPGKPFVVDSLPFRHAVCMLGDDPALRMSPEDAANTLHGYYTRLVQEVEVVAAASRGDGSSSSRSDAPPYTSHNLVLTPRWMLVVPRTRSEWRSNSCSSKGSGNSVHVNALGFAGLLLVRAHMRAALAAVSPLEVLRAVSAQPRAIAASASEADV